MIRTFLHLDLKPGRRDDVIDWYKETGALERAVREAGCLSTEIYPDPENDDRLLVTALWNSAADYDGWVSNPWRQSSTDGINEFLAEGFTSESKGSIVESLHHASAQVG
ncbi:putative quinol monooxygenase [Agrococcus casei]|uniref:ABM domain-containing protein n=2 Tax=Agrococcus TaxID=46352 RepID=A0A1R4GLV9_9MICO|nr:antibiotic biosynthesis monooxygenase family protein [Agrococcus casei]SJM69166.1 hypothetical protein CZ674_13080 [Agrococcus casei LMG 22410]